MLSPRGVIEDIRKTKYGVGLPPGSPERIGFDALRPVLDCAIQHLSDDLYAEDVHFVLELVQNADDNTYRPGTPAFIRFIRSRDRLLVQNNEAGFEEPHVRALCSIGQSSKKKAAGYIGEKGIGFKSVFRVSDEPHVYSNGYSFCFRRRDPETCLGFVVPEWVDAVPDYVDRSVTSIVLPLRAELSDEVFQGEWFGPSLLLFLKQLKTIEYADGVGGAGWCYRRVDAGETVELHSGEEVQGWRLVRSVTAIPSALREEKREGVTRSEVVLAFPLDGEGGADGSRERDAHAYLPVRGYGFRFVVQGDFILSSSREAILADRPWNHWLRDQVAPLFVTAVESFKEAEGALRTTFLSYVPEQKPAGLFGPVSDRIHASLREMGCVLTASGRWAKPGEVIVASEQLQAVISDADVRQILGREYMATQFKAPLSLLRSLGVLVFHTPELLRCLQQGEWLRGKPDGWFARLFAHLSTLDLKQDIDKLKALRLVPLEDGTLTSVAERKGRVFLPLTKETNYGFEDRLPLVRKAIFDGVDDATRSAAWKFLRSLGAKKADPPELIAEYILPLFESEEAGSTWKEMSDGFYIGSVEFIKDHLKEYSEAGNHLTRLRKGLYVKFVHPENRWYVKPDCLYLGEPYGNLAGLEKLLAGLGEQRFVDPVYLERGLERLARRWKKPVDSDPIQRRKGREAKGWTAFFRQIGLTETIRVVQEGTDTEPGQASSPDLERLFLAGDKPRIEQAVRHLDGNWSHFRTHLFTDVRRLERGRLVPAGRRRTKFGEMLASTCWLADKAGTLRRPSELFLDNPRTREVLGDDVPYLAVEFQDQRVAEDIGVHKGPTVEAALARLRNLATVQPADVNVLRTLYLFLDQQFDGHAQVIVSAFSSSPICVSGVSPARFFTSGQVFWQDPGPAFLGRRGFLSGQWPELKAFFVRKLGIALSPSPEDYAVVLRDLSQEEELSPQQERAVWAIYRELDRCLAAADAPEEVTGESWWRELVNDHVFWTDGGEFWFNQEDIFVNDRDEFHKLFKDHPEIAFLKVPPNQHPQVSRFLKAAGIPLLSEAVSLGHTVPTSLHDHPHLTGLCRTAVPYALRYLFYRENETYREKEAEGDLARLSGVSVRVCDVLEVEATLCGVSARVRQRFSSRLPQVFVAREAVDDLDGLAIELARMLGGSEGLGSFVAAVVTKGDAESIERFMRAKEIPALPPSEEDIEGALVATAEFNEDATPCEGDGGEAADELLDAGEAVPAAVADWESDETSFGEHPKPDAPVPPAFPPVREGTSTRSAPGIPPDGAGDPDDRGKRTNPETIGPPRHQPGPSVRPPARPATPCQFGGTPRESEPGHQGGDWVPLVSPGQTKVNVKDATPRSPTDRHRTFGERPATGHVERPEQDPDDEATSDRNPQSYAIGHWGEGYAFVALEAELSSRHPKAEVVRADGNLRFVVGMEVVAEVRWLNWQEDRGVGYDILVREGEQEGYVEVKATADEARACFEVTPAEWDCARLNGQRYRIFRVYNAGRPDARIEVLCDPHKLWLEGRLMARPVRIEL